MQILFLEDDHLQAEQVIRELKAAFRPTEVSIERVATEHAFRQRVDELASDPRASQMPDVAVLDVMVRWTDPAPEMPDMPPEVKEGKHYTAGLRCAELLKIKLQNLPVVIYSVLERQELEGVSPSSERPEITVTKTADISPLVNAIREITRRTPVGY